LGINPACLEEGERADIVLFDPNESWVVEESSMYSKGKNTPFLGKKLDSKVKYTIASGKIVYPFTGESV
jgi:dihydroorotase